VPKVKVMGDSISFSPTVDMLKNAMKGAGETHAAIANNIANVSTPGFQRSDVSFQEALAAAMPSDQAPSDSDELQMVTTNDRMIGTGPSLVPQPFEVTTTVDHATQMRVDGSNVDIDQEMAKLSINSSYQQTMGQLLQTQYTRIRQAIEEQA
jgi:flagellar basal-body rod protein FlgB